MVTGKKQAWWVQHYYIQHILYITHDPFFYIKILNLQRQRGFQHLSNFQHFYFMNHENIYEWVQKQDRTQR